MSQSIVLNPNETVLFEGDAALLKSALSIVQGNAIGTNQRFVFHGDSKGPITLQKADIQSAQEAKHGFATKWTVTTLVGERYQFQAENMSGLRQTMLTLTGQEALAAASFKQSELGAVKNGTAWLAAFGPLISGLLILLLWGGSLDSLSNVGLIKIWIFKLFVIYAFMRIDHVVLQRQGYNLTQLGIASPENIFVYLFSRAKTFGQSKTYAIVWTVLFAYDVATALNAFLVE